MRLVHEEHIVPATNEKTAAMLNLDDTSYHNDTPQQSQELWIH